MPTRRVALVVPALEGGGGVPVVAAFLYRVLRESGRYEPEVISLAMSSRDADSVRLRSPRSWLRGPTVRAGSWQGLPFRHVGAFGAELELQRYRPRRVLTRLLREYDLIQVVAGIPSWALVARHAGRPVGLQVATLAVAERQEMLGRGRLWLRAWRRLMTVVLARMDHVALRHLDAVFVENRWMYEHLRQRMDPPKVIFAPPGVDTERFRPAASDRPRGVHVLCVGRLNDPRKKVGLLFEAYARLRAELPTAPPLVLAGNAGPSDADWRVARRVGVESHVEVRENLPEAELVRLYREAALFVLSSDEEGLGLVILEAMACGIPVVSTDCGGPSTSVVDGETGYLVPRGDAPALAQKMRAILSDPALARRMGRAGRQRAVERFSLEATGSLFLEWYDRAGATSDAAP